MPSLRWLCNVAPSVSEPLTRRTRGRSRRHFLETLEPRQLLAATPGFVFGSGWNEGSPGDVNHAAYLFDSGSNSHTIVSSLAVESQAPASPTIHFSFDEGSGKSVNGGTIQGTLHGPNWVDGRLGSALQFDSGQDYVDLGSADLPSSSAGFTLVTWVRGDNTKTIDEGRIVSKATGTSEQDHYWMLSTIDKGGDTRLRFRLKTGDDPSRGTKTLIATKGTLESGTWHHVAATYDGTTMRLYLDGRFVGSTAHSGTVATNSNVETWIGGNPPNESSRAWKGAIDDFQIYDRRLNSTELQLLADADRTTDTVPPVIRDVDATATGRTQVNVGWTTNEPATSMVEFGSSPSFGKTTLIDFRLATKHDVVITGLASSTTYYYRVRSTDESGNENVSAVATITTEGDTTTLVDLAHFSFDEGSGKTAEGINQSGTLHGPSWVAGREGTALRFDGQQDYVDIGTPDVADNAIGLTLTAWIKVDDNGSIADRRIVSKAAGTSAQQHYWMLSTIDKGGDSRLRFRLKTGSEPSKGTTTLIANSGNLQSGVWHHAAATYDGAHMKLYLDGALVGSIAKTGRVATNNGVQAWIGGNPPDVQSRAWEGVIDDVRIYSKGLTAAEVGALADVQVISDITSPIWTPAANLDASNPSKNSIDLVWNAATDETGVSNYVIVRDGVEIDTVAGQFRSYTDTGLAPETQYSYVVYAEDSSGNRSTNSNVDYESTTAAGTTGTTTPHPIACSYDGNPNHPQDDPNHLFNGTEGRYFVSSNPIPAGFPTPLTTGICGVGLTPSDLTPYTGPSTITVDGTVIDGKEIGHITIAANNVTIRNSRITSSATYAFRVDSGTTGTLVEDTRIRHDTLAGDGGGTAVFALAPLTMRRVHITGGSDNIKSNNGDLTVEDSYITGTVRRPGSHNDVVQIRKGSNYTFTGNTMLGPYQMSTSVFIVQAKAGGGGGPISNVLIAGNYLSGGGYTVYTTAPDFPMTNVQVTDNIFESDSWQYGYKRNSAGANWYDNFDSIGIQLD